MPDTESFYGGAAYPLEPGYGSPIAYGSKFAELGTSVDARTANQVKEVSEHLNTGIKTVEVSGIDPGVFEAVPKDHLKELNRISKLTGTDLTFHAPMIDPSGIDQQGWDKMKQDMASEQLWSAVKRSHDLDPKGNINVTMHASSAQLPAAEFKVKGPKGEEIKSMLLVTPQGQLHQVKEEEKFFPRGEGWKAGKPIAFDPQREIKEENEKFWDRQVDQLTYAASFGSDYANQAYNAMIKQEHLPEAIKRIDEAPGASDFQKQQMKEELQKEVATDIKVAERHLPHAANYTRNAYNNLKMLFDSAYKNAEGKDKEKLDAYAKKIVDKSERINEIAHSNKTGDIKEFSNIVQDGVQTLNNLKNVQLLKPLREFAIEKSAETTADLALKGFKKFGDTAPVISLENHPAQQSLLTTGEDLRAVIKKARKGFQKKAMEQEGMSASEAKDQAEKLIGATWDVGHINMLRRYGYDKSDIVKETEKVAPFVKHVHLSDNFGFEHTELPMGMGNVPTKEIMKKLGKEGFKGKKVAEALSWWQHFSPGGKQNPAIIPTMHGMGASISGGGGPAWNQYMNVMGSYFGGYGTINPEIHHSLYGAGFSNLPQELGGQIAGKESRMTGTPMS